MGLLDYVLTMDDGHGGKTLQISDDNLQLVIDRMNQEDPYIGSPQASYIPPEKKIKFHLPSTTESDPSQPTAALIGPGKQAFILARSKGAKKRSLEDMEINYLTKSLLLLSLQK